ncbi:hypothetical protein J6590_086944 [Homalodisca vitripennis]|nr:hypothetical protein J6590_086941 [Homalodisca vitripennis]KAG8255690.1 hypothetical protein J6590_086944 [Homalodisca vitripennis]
MDNAEAFAEELAPGVEDPAHNNIIYLWLKAFDRDCSDDEDVGDPLPITYTKAALSDSGLPSLKAADPQIIGSAVIKRLPELAHWVNGIMNSCHSLSVLENF